MNQTQTRQRSNGPATAQAQRSGQAAAGATVSTGQVANVAPPRLPYVAGIKERFDIDMSGWRALTDAVFPNAKSTEAIILALAYCKARKLDPFKRVVHIVPMWNAALGREVETVWPGIAEHRTTAFRTGQYGGADPTAFGPTKSATFSDSTRKGEKLEEKVTFPEWAQITVYRMVAGQRVAFPGPRCYWTEYFSGAKGTQVPNARWCRAPFQMLEKCAEAAALRKAFPEEFGDEATAEEMEGRAYQGPDHAKDVTPADDAPARPARADFADGGVVLDHHADQGAGPAHDEDGVVLEDGTDEAAELEADRLGRQFAETGQVQPGDDAGDQDEAPAPGQQSAKRQQGAKPVAASPQAPATAARATSEPGVFSTYRTKIDLAETVHDLAELMSGINVSLLSAEDLATLRKLSAEKAQKIEARQ